MCAKKKKVCFFSLFEMPVNPKLINIGPTFISDYIVDGEFRNLESVKSFHESIIYHNSFESMVKRSTRRGKML